MKNFLFIPGNNPKMLASADYLGSDALLLDLEDAVSPTEKDAARILVRNAVRALSYRTRVGVRINAIDTEHWQEDLAEIVPLNVDFLVLPKAESSDDIRTLVHELSRLEVLRPEGRKIGIIALLETARGIENALEIALADRRIEGLFLGAEDLTATLRARRSQEGDEILYARSRCVYAARAAGIEAYDTPYTDVEDDQGLLRDAQYARGLGFSGKAAINPRQLSAINAAFLPTEEEVEYARQVMSAIARAKVEGTGVVALDGKMIDAPVVARAKYILETAGKIS